MFETSIKNIQEKLFYFVYIKKKKNMYLSTPILCDSHALLT